MVKKQCFVVFLRVSSDKIRPEKLETFKTLQSGLSNILIKQTRKKKKKKKKKDEIGYLKLARFSSDFRLFTTQNDPRDASNPLVPLPPSHCHYISPCHPLSPVPSRPPAASTRSARPPPRPPMRASCTGSATSPAKTRRCRGPGGRWAGKQKPHFEIVTGILRGSRFDFRVRRVGLHIKKSEKISRFDGE
jgi:hypothetical protein